VYAHRVHTERRLPISAYILSWWKNQPGWWGWWVTPTPFKPITITYKVAVYAPAAWVGRYTHLIWSLSIYVLCVYAYRTSYNVIKNMQHWLLISWLIYSHLLLSLDIFLELTVLHTVHAMQAVLPAIYSHLHCSSSRYDLELTVLLIVHATSTACNILAPTLHAALSANIHTHTPLLGIP
jgi:hypothetical protein